MLHRPKLLRCLSLFPLVICLGACAVGAVVVEEEAEEDPTREEAAMEVLEPGVEQDFEDGGVRLTLVEVPFDNRCPKDVQCITAGEARVTLAVHSEGSSEDLMVTLPAGAGPRTVNALGYRLELLKLEPVPISTRAIDPGEYRLHLRVYGWGREGESGGRARYRVRRD